MVMSSWDLKYQVSPCLYWCLIRCIMSQSFISSRNGPHPGAKVPLASHAINAAQGQATSSLSQV